MIPAALAWAGAKFVLGRSWVSQHRIPLLFVLALATFAGVQTWRVSSLKADNAALVVKVADANEAVRLSDALRGQEQSQDKGSFADQSDRCEARVNSALDAARAIEEVTNGHDVPQGAGTSRALVPAIELRRIIGQNAEGGAARVPAGGNGTAKP